MKNPKFNVAPANNAGENKPQWAVWHGNWQIATLWSEDTAEWVAELMNAGYDAIVEKRITEVLSQHQLGKLPEESSISS
jgi:diphthamide synthase (EF-2-diphthine--ammonia ligase)